MRCPELRGLDGINHLTGVVKYSLRSEAWEGTEEGQAGGGRRGPQMLQGLSQLASSVPGGSTWGSF